MFQWFGEAECITERIENGEFERIAEDAFFPSSNYEVPIVDGLMAGANTDGFTTECHELRKCLEPTQLM